MGCSGSIGRGHYSNMYYQKCRINLQCLPVHRLIMRIVSLSNKTVRV